MIEMIGVLVILAALAGALVPSIIRKVDQANSTKETANLNALATGLVRSIKLSVPKYIPNVAGMPATIANQANLPVIQVVTNSIGLLRAFMVDPNLNIGGQTNLPYTQSNTGINVAPASVRVMFVSSLVRAKPLTASETNSANFDNIWTTADNTKPSSWTNWTGTGYDLRIQRVDLGPLFHRLILVNHDSPGQPSFSIDNAGSVYTFVGTNATLVSYYLDSSVAGLNRQSTPALQARQVLTSDISFVFESGAWKGTLGGGTTGSSLPDSFAAAAQAYLNAPWDPNAHANQGQGSTSDQVTVITAMYSFMLDYTIWANEVPPFNCHGLPTSDKTPEYHMLDAFGNNGPNGFLYTTSLSMIQ